MTKNEAERCNSAYQMISTSSKPTPFVFKLYFVVTTLAKTSYTYGAGGNMRQHMGEPLELDDIRRDTTGRSEDPHYGFVLKIYIERKPVLRVEDEFDTYYYDYRDVSIEEKTKGIIDFILSGGKSKETPVPKIQKCKFDEKTIYHFNKNEKFYKG